MNTIPYIALLIYICFIQLITYKLDKNFAKKLFVILSYTAIALFIVLQKNIGPDYGGYIEKYYLVANVPWGDLFFSLKTLSIEPGFSFVNKVFTSLDVDPRLFLRIYMFVLVMMYGLSCYKYSENPIFFTFCLLVFMYKWILLFRQATAVVIIFLGFNYVKKKKFFPFLLTILFAMSFHITAIIAIFVYPIFNCNKDKNIRIFLLILMLLFIVFRNQFVNTAINIIGQIDIRYVKYFSIDEFSINMVVVFASIAAVMLLCLDRHNPINKKLVNLVLFTLVIQSSSAFTHMAGRIIMYMYPFIGLALERLFINETYSQDSQLYINIQGSQKILVLLIIVSALLFYWWAVFISINPYIVL